MVEEETLKTYNSRTPKSKKLWEASREAIPGGVGDSTHYFEPYPFFIERAKGSRVWDADGNEYIDYIMGYGINIAGHSHPTIVNVVREQLEKGTVYGMPNEKTLLLVKELLRRFPAMDMFQLANSGAEATMHAIRVARACTGKDKIVKIEGCYHGAHDYVLISVYPPVAKTGPKWAPTPFLQSEGVPIDSAKNTLIAPFNNIEAMEMLFKKHEGEIAAVMLEPIMLNAGVVLPKDEYLKDLRNLTNEHNILLIFDEIKTGCRVAPGGACELYNIKPDMITLAKATGGGLPFGAFGGKKEIMECLFPFGRTFHAGSYCSNPISVSAALACLTKVMTKDAHKHITYLGNSLLKGMEDVVEDTGVTAKVRGVGSVGCVFFTDVDPIDYRTAATADMKKTWEFWFNMVNGGVIPWGPCQFEEWYVSVAHTKEDVAKTIETAGDALRKAKSA